MGLSLPFYIDARYEMQKCFAGVGVYADVHHVGPRRDAPVPSARRAPAPQACARHRGRRLGRVRSPHAPPRARHPLFRRRLLWEDW